LGWVRFWSDVIGVSPTGCTARLLISLLLGAMTMGVIGFLGKYMGANMMLAEVSTMLSTPALTMARLTSGDPTASRASTSTRGRRSAITAAR